MREIQFYRNASGDCPVEQFLDQLGPKQAQKIAWVLRLAKELPLVPKQYLKKLEGTPEREIALAERRKNDYFNRKAKR